MVESRPNKEEEVALVCIVQLSGYEGQVDALRCIGDDVVQPLLERTVSLVV